jgi:hypothetical protein
MKHKFLLATTAIVLAGALQAHSASVVFNFEDNTDQGFGLKFSNDASASFPIVNIGGSLRMAVARTGAFQEADHGSGADPFLAAVNAAVVDPSGYVISYDWYVDTSLSPGNYGTFLQVGTYLNAGGGAYVQDFPGSGKDFELDGTQLGSGSVFSGTVTETLTAKYGALDPLFQGQTFMRFGFIMNGDGSAATVHFDNITVTPIPEPTSYSLVALGLVGFCMTRSRRSSRP